MRKVYIASLFSDKDRVAARAKELAEIGVECTSRWPYETAPHTATIYDYPHLYFSETAVFDVEDVLKANTLVLLVPTDTQMSDVPVRSLARGGRVFESGMFYGLMLAYQLLNVWSTRELIICGPRENVFHFLDGQGVTSKYPAIKQFDTWEQVKSYLGGK